MFIKKIDKSNKKKGQEGYFTYRLCESYRIDGKVRHRTILNVGKLEGIRKEDFKVLCDRIEQKVRGMNPLFLNIPSHIEEKAEFIYRRILNEKLLDCTIAPVAAVVEETSENTDIQMVDVSSISNEDSRSFGGEWLSKQIFDACGLPDLLSQEIDNEVIEKHIAIEVISRMIHPSSELETSRWLQNESSLCEMLALQKIPDHRKLYKAASALYQQKNKVEDHLYQYFAAKYPDRLRLCLYDLTNFYFEGRKEGSELAQFGRSKEKRNDAKLVSLALLTDGQGFIRRSKIYKGNIAEPSTLQTVVSELETAITKDTCLFDPKPVVVMDAGISTEENLKTLREKKFDYICVSRSTLKNYHTVFHEKSIKMVFDNRNNPVELSLVKANTKDNDDLYLYVKSHQKQQKELSMSNKLTKRFLQELENIKSSLLKKKGIKKEGAVNQRIGRLKQKYPSISKLYQIELKVDDNKTVNDIIHTQTKPSEAEGVYFIRCSQQTLTEELIWDIYNILRDLESTFRCLKTDLDTACFVRSTSIRPIYHKKDKNTEAHIFLGIVAYQLVHGIRSALKKEGINHCWKRIRNIMSSQTVITTRAKLENKDKMVLRNAVHPNLEQKKIYCALKFKQTNPKMKKKAVVPHN